MYKRNAKEFSGNTSTLNIYLLYEIQGELNPLGYSMCNFYECIINNTYQSSDIPEMALMMMINKDKFDFEK